MTKQTLVVKSGDTWEWEDTPELKAFRERHDYSKLATPLKEGPKKKLKPQAMRARRKALRHFKKCHMKTSDKRQGSYTICR